VTDASTESATPAPITVYWRPGCPFCSMLKRSLTRAGVVTTDINIWDDPAAAAVVRTAARGNETVPTVEVDGRFLVNPSAGQVMAAAGIQPARRRPRRRLFGR
jgi:glutaredoxin-like protein